MSATKFHTHTKQSPPLLRYLVPPRSKYSPQHLVLKHPQPPFLLQCQRPSFTPIQNNLLQSPVTSSLLGPNILLNTMFSNTLSKHFIFLHLKCPDRCWGASSMLVNEYRKRFPCSKSGGRGWKLTTRSQLMARIRISGATSPLLHKPPWRAQGQIYFCCTGFLKMMFVKPVQVWFMHTLLSKTAYI